MILAEKIMSLRKQNGWSQEELAEQMDVSRQSVSKWESSASIPDIEKILKMSELFGVSTDYLLKDEEAEVVTPTYEENYTQDQNVRTISLEEATEYMDTIKAVAKKIAFAVSICILSPVVLLLMGGMSEDPAFHITENMAALVGLVVLFLMIAGAVVIFVADGMRISKYDYLEKENISLKYGVEAVVSRRKEAHESGYRVSVTIGVVLCILSVVPIVIAGCMEARDFICVCCVAVLLFIISIAVFLFVSEGMVHGSFQKLLQEADYTKENKKVNKKMEAVSGAYWCIMTVIYLAWSFLTSDWHITWIVWPVSGVLYAAIINIIKAVSNIEE